MNISCEYIAVRSEHLQTAMYHIYEVRLLDILLQHGLVCAPSTTTQTYPMMYDVNSRQGDTALLERKRMHYQAL